MIKFIASGLINAPKNLIYRALNKPLKPRLLVIMVTDKCNSHCTQCNIWQQKPINNPLSPEEIGTALLSPVFNDVEQIIITGGECTLRDDLYEIIVYIKVALPKVKIIISTNGIRPKRVLDLVTVLEAKGICISVGTSLDGIGNFHDKIRGVPGNFKKVNTLLGSLPDTDKSVGFVLSELTVDNLPYVRGYLKRFGLKPFVQWCSGGTFYKQTWLPTHPKEGRNKLIEAVESLESKEAGNLLIKNAWIKLLRGKSIKFSCFSLHKFAVLKCNGDIAPCLVHFENSIGNIRDNTPEEIWNSDKALLERKCIKYCEGCLNSWGAGESYYAAFYPYLQYLTNPKEIWRSFK